MTVEPVRIPDAPTLTVDQTAVVLGISRNAAYEGVRRDEIPHIRIGKRIVVPTARLRELLGETP